MGLPAGAVPRCLHASLAAPLVHTRASSLRLLVSRVLPLPHTRAPRIFSLLLLPLYAAGRLRMHLVTRRALINGPRAAAHAACAPRTCTLPSLYAPSRSLTFCGGGVKAKIICACIRTLCVACLLDSNAHALRGGSARGAENTIIFTAHSHRVRAARADSPSRFHAAVSVIVKRARQRTARASKTISRASGALFILTPFSASQQRRA